MSHGDGSVLLLCLLVWEARDGPGHLQAMFAPSLSPLPAVFGTLLRAVRQPGQSLGTGQLPEALPGAMGGTPWGQGWKMGIYHPPASTAQGTNISHPTLMPAERPCLVCPEGKGLAVGDKSGSKCLFPCPGVGKSYSSPAPMDFSLALQIPVLP